MEQSGLSDIPQEIIDEIIDLCSRDKKTLKACSLTSRAWVHRTRKHLFSKLTLTDKTLPIWCGTVATPTRATGSLKSSPLASSQYPPVPSSYAPSWLCSYVTSLKITATYSESGNNVRVTQLHGATFHLSAFTQVNTLALSAVLFTEFPDVVLEACFGSLAQTVRELKLSSCYLDEEALFSLLRLFAHLESLELEGNAWVDADPGVSNISREDPPTLRGSLTFSGLTDANYKLLDSLATARIQYHTITVGYSIPSISPRFNVLFASCGDHLKKLIFTAPESGSRQSPFYLPRVDQFGLNKL